MKDIPATITRILAEQLGTSTEDLTASDKLEDLSADSLDLIEIVMAMEEEFVIEISDEEAERLATVQQLIDLVKGKVRG